MTRKNETKTRVQAVASPKKKPVESSDKLDTERPFDHGGLPDRDLKKNLGGC